MSIMKYKTQITLYNSYFNINNNLSTKSILNIFQDVASIHAEDLGVGYLAMLEKNLYWVLSRVKIDILKMPQINQSVIVETWPHVKGRIDFDRDLKILSLDGETLIIGTSKWCVIDTKTRTLQRTDNVNYTKSELVCKGEETGDYCLDKNYEEKFGKIILPEQEPKNIYTYTVMHSDLDHNKHMNNTNYANLVFNAVKNKNYTHFEINFLNECLLGDKIDVMLSQTKDGEYIIGKVTDKTAFTAFAN